MAAGLFTRYTVEIAENFTLAEDRMDITGLLNEKFWIFSFKAYPILSRESSCNITEELRY